MVKRMHAPSAPGPTTPRQRLISWAVICTLAATVVIAVVVLVFGSRSPSPPSLLDKPHGGIPGDILFRDESQCVVFAPASGATPTKISCRDTNPSPLTWIDDETVGVVKEVDGQRVLLRIEVGTGDEIGRAPVPEHLRKQEGVVSLEPVSSKGARARVDDRGRLFVRDSDGQEKEVANFDTQASRLQPITWSPDGEWLMLYYTPEHDFSRNELWIVGRDGRDAGLFYRGTAAPFVSWRIDGLGHSPQ